MLSLNSIGGNDDEIMFLQGVYTDSCIAPKLGCSPDSLRVWCQQAERDAGQRGGLTGAEKDRIKELEREVRELRQADEILKKASAYFAAAELDRPFRK